MADNIVLSVGSGGPTVRTLAESGGTQWSSAVCAYATTVSAGANVLQVVTASAGLPVAQQGTWTVQPGNTANTTAWKVDGSSVTQPVSGTFWQATQPVSGTVTANIGTSGSLALDASVTGLVVSQASTTSGQKGGLIQGAVTTSAPSYTTAQTSPFSLDTSGNLRVTNTPSGTQTVSGTVAATQSGTWTVQPGNTANTTAWKVDGSAVTQPVSGTVTANIGTSGSLALDASVNGVLLAQASTTSGQSGPLIQGAVTTSAPSYTTAKTSPLSLDTTGNLRVLASQTGTWNVGTVTTVTTVSTVTAVTSITNALPAGTNLLGQISASDETGTIYSGTTALTPKFAIITASASGATQVVALVSSKKIRVLRWRVSANGTVNVKWQSHVTPTDKSGLSYCTQYKDAGGGYCPVGHFETIAGEALDINLSASIAVSGELTYVEV